MSTYGWAKPLSDFGTLDLSGVTVGSNDTILAAAEADSTNHFYIPFGVIRTNLTQDQLTKGYKGDGALVTGPGAGDGAFRPANWSYMAVKPSTWPVQGVGGWFNGDQRFTDSGEWKIIGPNVRTYDLTARYYESNTIPHHAWMEAQSGNSGVQAFLTSGASIGATTITLNGAASAEWVGKTVGFTNGMDQAVLESHTVTAVSGNTITLDAGLTHAYTWNPSAGVSGQPCILFGHRTWAGHSYIKLTHGGGGDAYGHNVRTTMTYQPKPTEQAHPFMAGTASQYGGDVTAGADGQFLQFFESQIQAGTYDITAMGLTLDMVRNKDATLQNGRFTGGVWMQSGGTRPFDVGVTVLGAWRNAMDTAFASLYETSYLVDPTIANAVNVHVRSLNGVHVNDPITIGEPGAVVYSGVITGVNVGLSILSVTPALPATPIPANTLVTYQKGGAALNLAANQRIIWNSTVNATGRSSDAMGVYPTFYGNGQGDLIMESGTDASGEFWAVRFARGTVNTAPDTARIRMRTGGVQIFGTGGHTFAGTSVALAAGCDLNLTNNAKLSLGSACWLTFDGTHIKGTVNGGATFVTLV